MECGGVSGGCLYILTLTVFTAVEGTATRCTVILARLRSEYPGARPLRHVSERFYLAQSASAQTTRPARASNPHCCILGCEATGLRRESKV
jgi:hypothetical protein